MDFNKIKNDNITQNPQDGINNGTISNPIDTTKIMPLNTRTSANRIYGGWANSIAKNHEVNYLEIISAINASVLNQKDTVELFYSIHKQICLKMDLDFLAVGIYNNASNYINATINDLEALDITTGVAKAAVFGFIISLMGCYNGYKSRGGAQGVGNATTTAVVSSSILILIFNYLITEMFFSR